MDSKTVIRMIEEKGWKLVRVKGSHHQFKHPDIKYLITVPHPDKDVPKGTLRNILKIAGLL